MVQTNFIGEIGSLPGIPVRGIIRDYDIKNGLIYVSLPGTFPSNSSDHLWPVKIPAGWVGADGSISAGFPTKGTGIFCTIAQGGEWVFLNYDHSKALRTYTSNGKRRVSSADKFAPGRWLTLVDNDIQLIADPKQGIIFGDSIQNVQADPVHNLYSTKFDQQMNFSEGHRHIIGPIKRDLESNSTRNIDGSSLSGHSYNSSLRKIGLDPKTNVSVSSFSTRNPGLVENRSMFYEFNRSFGYTNDIDEEKIYSGEDIPSAKPYQRKNSITDTTSLSLDQPNFLLETVIGTIVDIYGNILDINRNTLPNGLIDSLSFRKSKENQEVVFKKLLEQLRKSIAYHFEINARKDNFNLPDYNDNTDYSRDRSRFHFDIDKEGQFKLNVPSSSEVGNIPLLVRHENFSNLKGAETNVDRGQFLRNATNNKDIFLEPHGVGAIEIKSNEDTLKSFISPTNRFDGNVIKLGTAYHDISKVLYPQQTFEKMYSDETGTGGYPNSDLNNISKIDGVVSLEVIAAGEGANAGGRSGTISMDGFLSLSIGANTIDRQSLWLDCAGGIVSAIGRDRFNRSVSASLDGDLFLEIGGATISNDSRFTTETSYNNETRDGVVDIRIWNSGSFHTIRIDSQGIKIHTPQRIDIVSEGEMRFKSVKSKITFDAERILFYGSSPTPRLVKRIPNTI